MLMSAPDAVLGVPRAFTIDTGNLRTVTVPTILPYSISSTLETLSRGESPGRQHAAAESKTQHAHTPFTQAPPEACAAFAGLCAAAAQDPSGTPVSPYRSIPAPHSTLAPGTALKELKSAYLASTLSAYESASLPCCTEQANGLDASCNGTLPCSNTPPCTQRWGPPHGAKAVCGKRSTMEDTYAVQTNFFGLGPDIALRVPSSTATDGTGRMGMASDSFNSTVDASLPSFNHSSLGSYALPMPGPDHVHTGTVPDPLGNEEMLHFFAVYDGHGGTEAAHHCAARLHLNLHEALSQQMQRTPPHPVPLEGSSPTECVGSTCRTACMLVGPHNTQAGGIDDDGDASMSEARNSGNSTGMCLPRCGGTRLPSSNGPAGTAPVVAAAGAFVSTPSERERSALGSSTSSVTAPPTPLPAAAAPGCLPTSFPEAALREAFLKTDREFAADASAAVVGSTAVVALLGSKKLWVANCGDSRAVLCQNGKAIQLTQDHKPERKDEAERVEKAGGHVLYWNGHRVMGVLAMSRAIGDHGLRPYIIPEPEISVVTRSDDDDFLMLASDGLWDVMSNQEAADLATRCLTRAIEKGATRKAAVRISASVLTKAAIDRGSKDNVTVVMVDLKAKGPEADDAANKS